jgi:nitrogen fixation/metabolism regulation signal transduction histidine kinase
VSTEPDSRSDSRAFGSSTTGLGSAKHKPKRRTRSVTWAVGVAGGAILAMALVLMFLLAQATGNRELYEQYYQRLFIVNVVVAGILAISITWVGWRLYTRLRRGRFGSRLLIKLAAVFGLVGLLPGLLIYTVSYQFVSRSIESWFDVKVEGALYAGINLGRTTLDTLSADLAQKARNAAPQVAEWPSRSMGLPLERLREQVGASDAVVWDIDGQLLASAGASRFSIAPERPSPAQLRQLRTQRVITLVEGLEDTSVDTSAASTAGARVRVLAAVNPAIYGLAGDLRFLQLTQPLPRSLVTDALAVTQANREYQERALGREGLRRMYIGTLTLSLFLAVFGAVLLAVVLGNQLVQPLLFLADGVRQVAAGDLSPKAALQGKDELGGLTRDFAQMTQQLSDARSQVQRSMAQVDASRANVQTILDNLTAGVIVMDSQGRIQTCNPGATRVLRAPVAAYQGYTLAQVPHLEELGRGVQEQFESMLGESTFHGLDHWQQSFDLPAEAGHSHTVNLIARGAVLTGDRRLLVLDDISEVVSAQRAQAWAEVARRLAHEIKNPLTPIQLSAERLWRKLGGKLPEADEQVLAKSVKTIVDQVDAMKRLVNEFRDYARLPAASLQPLSLNALLEEVLSMYSATDAPEGSALRVPVRQELDPNCPPVLGDAQQLRQVIHNLVQNAQDATEGTDSPQVTVRTQWLPTAHRVRLVVRDSGSGFPESILKRAFEPYVTTKAKGTGLGLAVVKKIADEHGARLEINNRQADGRVAGAQVSLSFPVATEVVAT